MKHERKMKKENRAKWYIDLAWMFMPGALAVIFYIPDLLKVRLNSGEARVERKENIEMILTNVENHEETLIDYNAIEEIESSGNPKAHNRKSGARGLRQITPVVLEEWNAFHPKEQYNLDGLFNEEINRKIGNWYLDKKIPRYLKDFGLKDSIENRLAAYNWGIGNLRKISDARENFDKLPKETRDYITKYERLTSSK